MDLLCADAALADLVRRVGGPMLAADDGTLPDVRLDVAALAMPEDADVEQRAARTLSAVDRAALCRTHTLPIHAAAVAGPRGCVVMPGESGRGKTTLAAAAMQVGLTLLSDEAACLTEPAGSVLPHPRPLGLSAESRRLLGAAAAGEHGIELACAPDLFGRSAPNATQLTCVSVVIPRRCAKAPATLKEIGRMEALSVLLACRLDGTTGGSRWPDERAWRHLAQLVSTTPVRALTYDHPHDGARMLSTLLT